MLMHLIYLSISFILFLLFILKTLSCNLTHFHQDLFSVVFLRVFATFWNFFQFFENLPALKVEETCTSSEKRFLYYL